MGRTPTEIAEGYWRRDADTLELFSATAFVCRNHISPKSPPPKKESMDLGLDPYPHGQVENATALSAPSAGGSQIQMGGAGCPFGRPLAYRFGWVHLDSVDQSFLLTLPAIHSLRPSASGFF